MTNAGTILIIDDDPYGRDALDLILGMHDYELFFAENGPQGLRQAAALVPDLILLDVTMPGMDGFEVCTRIRGDAVLADVPVVMITALHDRESRLRGIRAGADDFITKPIDTVELLARVHGITRLNRYRRMLEQRNRLDWAMEQAEDGYLVVDAADRIGYANPAARRWLGQSADTDALEGRAFLEEVGRSYRCEPVAAWREWAQRSAAGHVPLYLIAPESASAPSVWLQVTTLDSLRGPQGRRLIRLEDVTQQMGALRNTWTFRSLVSHKLYTSLDMILNSLDLLNLQPPEELSQDELREMLRWITEGMQRLRESVTGVLRFAATPDQVHAGALCQIDHLPAMIERIRATLRLAAVEVHLPTNCLQPICLTAAAMEVVLLELLQNAKKFHPQHNPHVTVEVTQTAPSTIHIAVMDDGRSLSAAELESMWTPYYQGERIFTGEAPGIGLAMVRNIVWQADGVCRATRRNSGPGLVIEIVLPLGAPFLQQPAYLEGANGVA